jgi:hypothetical protein
MQQPAFTLREHPFGWLGGEPRTVAVHEDERFPNHWPASKAAKLIAVTYTGGGVTKLLDEISAAAGVMPGSFQAVLENLEDLSHEKPLVVFVRRAHHLMADVGPAILHLVDGWETFTHHANGISAMYLVLETGPRGQVDAAFYPGGVVNWLSGARP